MLLLRSLPKMLILFMFIFACAGLNAQEKKVAPTSEGLFIEIAKMDSVLFGAFNTQNMVTFQSMFTKDLEWFQDNDGLIPYDKVFQAFANHFKSPMKLTRELVPGSLEIHPIKNYGAIEIGVHRFRHMENGKEETGTFKFLMIWKKTGGKWKISRVISYDH